MQTYLSLGSNLGDRRDNLRQAIELLGGAAVDVRRVSPVVESPALLPAGAPADWNLPYLNLVLECEAAIDPEQLRASVKQIERSLGRGPAGRWAPRPMDIDILLWGDREFRSESLTIPHPSTHLRNFVLTPLVALQPGLEIDARGSKKTVLEWSRELPSHIPLWMGIINVTPDSFSDGGRFMEWKAVQAEVEAMIQAGVHIIDIGAESTRPGGAAPLSPEAEWIRLEPVLQELLSLARADRLSPLVSVDTYHPTTARRALDLGADIINDVTGLTNPEMLELAQASRTDWIAMHSLTIPADFGRTLPAGSEAVELVDTWLVERLASWNKAGLDLNRIIFDPGIGFGKDALQSLDLLRSAGEFRRHGLRVLVGHSRKSFLKSFTPLGLVDKDLATTGASLSLCQQGVDILRVHNVPMHAASFRGYSHVLGHRRSNRSFSCSE
jgi:dihydropteroate synthase/2-amino-4-hydroxy-6-hydroxymethyldihydropteridine diphosphokinase